MPSKNPISRFEDIVGNIERIERYTASIHTEDAFEENPLVYDAVERCLQRISEAATKLSNEAETLCPAIPWRAIRGLGNVLRHDYDRVESSRLWITVQDDLPRLKAAVLQTLFELRRQP